MPTVFVSIGSNVDRERNIRDAVVRLRDEFDDLQLSPIYESAAVGFDGDPFLNLVVSFETDLLPDELNDHLHVIEQDMGRDQSAPSFSARGIDLDLLLYADLILKSAAVSLPRKDIEDYVFVLKPLADLAPNHLHPIRRISYLEMLKFKEAECATLVEVDSENILKGS